MTDIEIIRAMLKRADLEWEEGSHTDDEVVYNTITVEDRGYSGFVSQFWFDQSFGDLKHMAGWE